MHLFSCTFLRAFVLLTVRSNSSIVSLMPNIFHWRMKILVFFCEPSKLRDLRPINISTVGPAMKIDFYDLKGLLWWHFIVVLVGFLVIICKELCNFTFHFLTFKDYLGHLYWDHSRQTTVCINFSRTLWYIHKEGKNTHYSVCSCLLFIVVSFTVMDLSPRLS